MILTFKYKLLKSHRQKKLQKVINASALAYNHCIALHKRYYSLYSKTLEKYKLQKHLTKLKQLEKYSYLKEIPSQALQDITDRIDRAYKLFFHNLEHKIKCSPPSFKKIKKYKSFTLKQAGYKLLEGNEVQIGQSKFKYYKSRDIKGEIKTVTIKRDNLNDVYLYFVSDIHNDEIKQEIKSRAGNIVGLDFGLKTFLVGSDQIRIESPLYLHKQMKSIKRDGKKLSKKKEGSCRYTRARKELAQDYKRVVNQRREFHYQTALDLVRKYETIVIENLNLKGMQKLYGRKISDLGFYNFVNILEHMADKYGCKIIKVARYYPSSQLCSSCNYQNQETKDLRVRQWRCPQCGTIHDRDQNAAINIEHEGLRLLKKYKVGTSTLVDSDSKTKPSLAVTQIRVI